MNRSIFRKLLLSHLTIILVGLVSVGLITSYLVKGYLYENRREQLVRQAKQINLALLDSQPVNGGLTEVLTFLDRSFDARIWLFDIDGKIVATSTAEEVYVGKSVSDRVLSQVMEGKEVVEPLVFEGLDEPMLSVVVPRGKGNQLMGGLIIHAPVQGLNRTVGHVRETILWATLVAVLISTLVGSYLSWSISRPLKEMEMVAAEIGSGKYSKRVTVQSEDEIGDLARAINSMATQLAAIEHERQSLQRAREDLFANISHELRSPLTAILGFLEALQDGFAENREQQQIYLAVTYREALHLKGMVEDLLDLTRLQAGRVSIHRVPLDVVSLAEAVRQKLVHQAEARGNLLRVEAPAEGLVKALADPARLTQILTNLVENAIKFTEQGQITVRLSASGEQVVIQVADTGIGINQEDLPMIWERFYKADRLRSRNRAGTGLGLAIVRELVHLHGGEIQVESKVSQGTVFTLNLPALVDGQ